MTTNSHYIYNANFLKAIRKNKRNSALLVLGLLFILMSLGYLIGWYIDLQLNPYGVSTYSYQAQQYYYQSQYNNQLFYISRTGLTVALVTLCIGILWTAIAIFGGPKLMLFSVNAHEVSHQDIHYLGLTNVVQEISIAAGIMPPKIYLIETPELNAFATGMSPKTGCVAITRGLLEKLNRDELQGVMAHEIGHIINYDIRYQTLVSIIVGLIVLISDIASRTVWYGSMNSRQNRNNNRENNNGAAIIGLILLIFSIVAPIAALMLQMAVSRQREYLADATSVKLTRNPLGLISALAKLAEGAKPFAGASKANQNLFIVNPFRNVAKIKSSLFATHPPIEARIERLQHLDK